VDVAIYDHRHRAAWDDVVARAPRGPVFHRHEFLGYHPDGRFDWHHLVFGNPGTPFAVLPGAVAVDGGRRTLRSTAGASVGGPASSSEPGVRDWLEWVDALVDHARGAGLGAIELALAPAFWVERPDDALEFALRVRGFASSAELGHCVDLPRPDGRDIIAALPAAGRRRARRALAAGLELASATSPGELREFHAMLCANKELHDARPAHTGEEIIELCERLGERLQVWIALERGVIVAGVYAIAVNAHVVYTQYIADLPARRELDATRFVLLSLIARLRRGPVRYLDLGSSVVPPAEKLSLARFKESLGAFAYERRRWRLVLADQVSVQTEPVR